VDDQDSKSTAAGLHWTPPLGLFTFSSAPTPPLCHLIWAVLVRIESVRLPQELAEAPEPRARMGDDSAARKGAAQNEAVAEEGGASRAERGESVSQAAQASGGQINLLPQETDLSDLVIRVLEQAPAVSSAGGKRPFPAALGHRKEEEGPRLSLVTALPLSALGP
jgi:hypothetical protein